MSSVLAPAAPALAEVHQVTGGCLCGAVRFSATLPGRGLTVCWCSQCLRQNSGPLVSAGPAADLAIDGRVQTYRATPHAVRGFCPICSSTIYWQDEEGPFLAHGAFDSRDGYRIENVVHGEGRPDAYDLEAAR